MKGFKEDRMLRVYSLSGGRDYGTWKPTIRLTGNWVREMGFDIGERIKVHCERGRLTITLESETSEGLSTEESKRFEEKYPCDEMLDGVLMVAENRIERGRVWSYVKI